MRKSRLLQSIILLFLTLLITSMKFYAENEIVVESRGAFRFFWSNQPGVLETKIASDTDETYNPNDRYWNGLPTITITAGGRLWAAWMTGGNLEPDVRNYNVLYYSDDGGSTWSEDFLIVESVDEQKAIYTPHLFVDDDGLLWYYINYGGTWGIIINNPDCDNPSIELEFAKNVFNLTPNPLAHIPIILSEKHNNIWLAPLESSNHLTTQRIFSSTNKVLWEEHSALTTSSPAVKRFNESQIVELKDGKLMILSRLDGGTGMERAYSSDGGVSWTAMETDLGSPYIGPGSKFEIRRLNSGNLLLLNHNSTSAREKITAYLSEDDGKTWPYQIPLDDRIFSGGGYWGVSYPDFTQGKDGTIYIVWDQRKPLIEINFARLTENDIKTGVLSETSFTFSNLVRNSNYVDVKTKSVNVTNYVEVELGTLANDIIKDLPTNMNITNMNDESITINGSWRIIDYNPNTAKKYYCIFESDDIPNNWIDSYGILRFTVEVKTAEDNKPDDVLPIILIVVASIAVISLATIFLVYKKKKRKREE